MSLAYWRDICTTQHPEIDQEHLKLLKILEDIYQSIQVGEEGSLIQSKLHLLFEVALAHCETEERLMETYSYPERGEHTDKHEELLNNVLNLRLKAEDQAEDLTLDMIHGMAAWLNRHSWDFDLKMVQYLQQRQRNEAFLFS